MKVEVTQTIDRPVATVFEFYAHHHLRNHPRWDPEMELEQITDGPMGVGTVIRRRHTHFEEPVEGRMEIIEFEENRSVGVVIHEGDTESFGRIACEPAGPGQTRLFVSADIPAITDPEASERLAAMMQRTADNIKKLIETET